MTENALLLTTRPDAAFQRAGGLTVIERQLQTAARAGLRKIWVGLRQPEEKVLSGLRLPAGLSVVWTQRQEAARRECAPPYLVVSGDHFIRPETLAYAVRSAYPVPVALQDGAGATVVQAVPSRSEKFEEPQRQSLPPGSSISLVGGAGREEVLRWLLAAGTKPQDGFMARNLDRHISLAVTRLLLNTRVSPNAMTAVSTAVGLAGAALFSAGTYGTRLAGACLVWLHSVIDGCDGELSRIRHQESDLGADLDFWGDNLVHLALFACIAAGFYRAEPGPIPVILGAAAVAGSLGSAAVAYRQRLARRRAPQPAPAGTPSSLSRLEDMLAARDFIYLLLVLAALDLVYPFLWAAGAGSIAFFIMTTYLGRLKNEQARKPDPSSQGQARGAAARDGRSHQHLHSGS